MTDVEIEYCVPCGHLDRAQDLQRELLSEFGQRINGVRLKTGDGGVFVVRADGEPIYDKSEDGDLNVETIKDQIRTRTTA
ncbi:MAG: SelT/SelW/SelH family protein [Halobacteriaceae archaeon]